MPGKWPRIRIEKELLSGKGMESTIRPSSLEKTSGKQAAPYAVLIFAAFSSPSSRMLMSRISTFRILPVTVMGKLSVNLM